MARKPLDGNTITANVLKHGVGGLNLGGVKFALVVKTDFLQM